MTQVVKFTESEDADANIEAAVNLIQGSEGVVTGLAMDTEFSTALAKVTNGEMGPKMYPELAWGANPDSINGLKSSVNTTVGAGADEAESKDLVIIGDFESMFKWGYAKQIPMEIIKYGDPDNSGKDLKGYNQIYLRAEAYIGWGILDAKSFARVTKGEV